MSRVACADFWRWCATVPVIGFTFAVAGLSGCGAIGRPQAGTTSNSDTLFSTVAGEEYGYEIVAAKSDDSAGEWTFALKSQRPPKDNNLRFEWEIDGQAYQGLAVSHIFSETGTFVISVRAIEPNGNDVFVLTLEIQIELPPPPNQAPVAVALAVSKDGRVVVRDGSEGEQVLAVYENEQVFLDGSGSYDPDGDDTSFEWAQVTGNAIHLVQLVDASAAVASFVAPTVDGDARLAFTLIVSDEQRSTEVIVPVDVLNIVEIVGAGPEADAGPDQQVTSGDLVRLDGSNSSGSGSLRFQWTQTSGPVVDLANENTTSAAFIAPAVGSEAEQLVFELAVTEGDMVDVDEVTVMVNAPALRSCDIDTDGDGLVDCNDGCPSDPDKSAPARCGCGQADSDSDEDGVADCVDQCPGAADVDGDGDGIVNCLDACPEDPAKVDPGTCGCGLPDTDTDGDGQLDCNDGCPNDPDKIDPGLCGCGVADTDSDSDATPDCSDNCPTEANADQTDTDGDGVGDVCESEPSECKTGSSDWQNALFEQEQTGTFDVEFYATPGAAPVDAIVALSSGEGSDFSHYAVLVRFNSAGTIDARNGGSYASDNTIRYTADRKYRFRLVVNVPLKIYSVFVTPPESDEDEIVLATDYAFRSDQSNVAVLDHWGLWADLGTHDVCDLTVSTPPPDTDPPSVPTGLSGTPVSSSQISLAWTRSTDNVAVAGYNIFRNSAQIASVSTASYHNFGLTPATQYSYTVSAYDAVGNESAQSPPVEVTTPDQEPPDETCDYVIYPHESINKYSSVAQPGQTVCVSAGTYTETLAPANSGSNPDNLITFKAYPGHECQGEFAGTKSDCQVVIDGQRSREIGVDLRRNFVHYIRVEGFEIINFLWNAVYIRRGNDAANPGVGIEIVNNFIHDNGGDILGGDFQQIVKALDTKNSLIENNEIWRNSGTAIQIGGLDNLASDGLVIRGNNIHYNGKDGVRGGGQNMLIEHNRIYDQFHTMTHQDGLDLSNLKNVTIRYNYVYDCTQNIMFHNLDGGLENIEVYGNVTYTDRYYSVGGPTGPGEAPGIFMDARFTPAPIIKVSIHSNTCGWVGYGGIIVLGHASDLKIHNNILYDAGILVDVPDPNEVNSDYNLFFTSPRSEDTATAWMYEGPNSVFTDPKCVNYERHVSHDFRLLPTSPAIDAGDPDLGAMFTLPNPFVDLDGNQRPQGGEFDMGAYEYVVQP